MDLKNAINFRTDLRTISEILSIFIIIIGVIVLIGWALNIPLLKSPSPDFPTIKSNVALCFILVGASLWLQQTKRINVRNRRAAQISAIIVLIIGLLTIMEHLFNFNFGLDQILFIEPYGALNTSSPNRIAFVAAIELVIISTALLILDKKVNKHAPAQYLMILGGILALMVLIILSIFVWNSILSLNKTDRKRKEANKKLKKNLEELERSNRELQSFAFITSHDLQEPLRTMASYAQLIERRYKGQLDPYADEFLEYMVGGAKRMKSMIQGLLDYSQVEAKNNEFKEISAEKALDNALSNLQYSIDQCHAEVNHDPLPWIFADEDQIVRVSQNLIGNALKFRKKDETPKIHISAKKDDNEWIFSVKDNGIGIEDQYFDKIFEVFKRLHAIGEYFGAGIGLAIVKRVIDRHGGHIWVESSPEKGSTFYFTIHIKL